MAGWGVFQTRPSFAVLTAHLRVYVVDMATFTLPCSVPAHLSGGAALDMVNYCLVQSLLAPQGSRDFIYEALGRLYMIFSSHGVSEV